MAVLICCWFKSWGNFAESELIGEDAGEEDADITVKQKSDVIPRETVKTDETLSNNDAEKLKRPKRKRKRYANKLN